MIIARGFIGIDVSKNDLDVFEGGSNRSLGEIARQPVFMVAAVSGALSYGVMNLLMAATPLAMQVCGLPFEDTAWVLEWHVIGMFAPGFFTGQLIKRYGAVTILAVGVVLNLICIAVALSGVDVMHFLISMFLVGVGWNFLFVGATTLLTTTYRPSERGKAQAFNDFMVFGTTATASLLASVVLELQGWAHLNYVALVLVCVALLIVGTFRLRNPARI